MPSKHNDELNQPFSLPHLLRSKHGVSKSELDKQYTRSIETICVCVCLVCVSALPWLNSLSLSFMFLGCRGYRYLDHNRHIFIDREQTLSCIASYTRIQHCSVQLSSRWYLCIQKSQYLLHPISQTFSQHCLSYTETAPPQSNNNNINKNKPKTILHLPKTRMMATTMAAMVVVAMPTTGSLSLSLG